MTDQAQNLRAMSGRRRKNNTKVITVTSGKGGVGKSSVALNMAIALNRKGKRALIIDMDFGFSNIDVMLGVSTKYDLLDVIENRKDISEIIETGLEGVKFISGGSGVYELVNLNGNSLGAMLQNLLYLDDIADVIIFDTSAGASDNMLRLIQASHETILVTTPEPTAVVDAYALMKIVSEQACDTKISLVLNFAQSAQKADLVMDGIIQVARNNTNLNVEKHGFIMRDINMEKAVRLQIPILISFPKCKAAANIEKLASKYLHKPQQDTVKLGMNSFLERFLAKRTEH